MRLGRLAALLAIGVIASAVALTPGSSSSAATGGEAGGAAETGSLRSDLLGLGPGLFGRTPAPASTPLAGASPGAPDASVAVLETASPVPSGPPSGHSGTPPRDLPTGSPDAFASPPATAMPTAGPSAVASLPPTPVVDARASPVASPRPSAGISPAPSPPLDVIVLLDVPAHEDR
jgi:hypothetical protein